jgi:hypothetical protein
MGWSGFDVDRLNHAFVSNIENMNWIFDRLFCHKD